MQGQPMQAVGRVPLRAGPMPNVPARTVRAIPGRVFVKILVAAVPAYPDALRTPNVRVISPSVRVASVPMSKKVAARHRVRQTPIVRGHAPRAPWNVYAYPSMVESVHPLVRPVQIARPTPPVV